MPKLSDGIASCAAIQTPTSMPTTPQTTVMMANWRTTRSLYSVEGFAPARVAAPVAVNAMSMFPREMQ